MKLVKNKKEYWESIREVRTHPNNIGGFIEQGEITTEQQKEYMSKHNDHYYVCLAEYENTFMGFIGVIDNDIRLAVSPGLQGYGTGTFMINEIRKIFPEATAKVRVDNFACNKAFRKARFEITGTIKIGEEQFNVYKNGNV